MDWNGFSSTAGTTLRRVTPSLHTTVLLISAIGLLLLGYNSASIHEFVVDGIGLDEESWLSTFINDHLVEAKWIGWVILISSIMTYFVASGIERFFREKISPMVNNHVAKLSNQLEESSNDTKELLSAKLLDNMVAAAPREAIKNKLKDIHEKAYGPHCGHERGLYSALSEKLSPFLEAETPHRSDYHQTVTVRENGDNSIIWHEVCSYQIHTVCLEENQSYFDEPEKEKKEAVTHTIRYVSIVKAAELTFDGDNAKYKLKISIDDETVFDSSTDLHLKEDKVKIKPGVEGVKVEQNGNSFKITFEKEHQIEQPWTSVEIMETSTILDDYFISRRNEPTCGAKITMNLPDDWEFELIRFGHPDDWTIHQHPGNTLSAWTSKWLLPGITFFCKWQRPDMQQLALSEEGQQSPEEEQKS